MILMLIIDEKSLPTTSLSFILLSDNPHHQAVGWGSRDGHPATWSAQGFSKLTLLFLYLTHLVLYFNLLFHICLEVDLSDGSLPFHRRTNG